MVDAAAEVEDVVPSASEGGPRSQAQSHCIRPLFQYFPGGQENLILRSKAEFFTHRYTMLQSCGSGTYELCFSHGTSLMMNPCSSTEESIPERRVKEDVDVVAVVVVGGGGVVVVDVVSGADVVVRRIFISHTLSSWFHTVPGEGRMETEVEGFGSTKKRRKRLSYSLPQKPIHDCRTVFVDIETDIILIQR